MPFVSGCCEGERCYCGKPAEHKVEETIFDDDPHQGRHPFTTYICHEHFVQIMGPAAELYRRLEDQGAWPRTPPPPLPEERPMAEKQLPATLTFDTPDGSTWGVPVMVIARDRATHYAKEFDGDVERSLTEDTIPLFCESDYEIKDWAANNMNWSDVASMATKITGPKPLTAADMQEAWVNGEKDVI